MPEKIFKLDLDENNEDFINKYKSYLQNVEKEEMQHYSNRIFDKEEIEKIIKSKKDLVMEGLKRDYNIEIDKKKIILSDTVKNLGMITVDIKLYEGVIGKLKVDIIAN